MFEYLAELYSELLVVRATHKVFSWQSIIAFSYLLALILSIYRAHFNRERFSDFLSIAVVVVKYLLTSLLMERVLIYIETTGNWQAAQNVYLALFAINILSMFVVYLLHARLSYKFGGLFFAVLRITAALALSHFILWFKFVVLNIQEPYPWVHYTYSFVVLCLSAMLAVAMLFPNILLNRFGCIIGLSLPRGRE
ncbi:hypothetical protein MTF66_19605 [Pseudoalteromonas sp. 2CM39R]|mgnify:CR=1 FL=1|uniref:hypothetical protein n=1 Tax=Pseudoalteromonas sp. 2CM39R TaxID=2929856 RepID=UPI0020BDC65F|nr:hypothetical protein [Pseudoalteromonas sp. 2CM39R]MCK8127228.1 hypothetical protein [Pseudoalteromonas sp. 2CM39R]